jgi:hypothetical protein
VLTPIAFSYQTGHFRSSLRGEAVESHGEPIPWYTYPATWFLQQKNFTGKTVLEFGGGQSTLWWARRAAKVVVFEGDQLWCERLKSSLPSDVEVYYDPAGAMSGFEDVLRDRHFDVIVIDPRTGSTAPGLRPHCLHPAAP